MLYIAANRLPLTVTKEQANYKFSESPGGVATGLRTWVERQPDKEIRWVGWPGIIVRNKSEAKRLREQLLHEQQVHPIFLTKREMEDFYGGFCNKTIWPLFHYFTSHATFDPDDWRCYCKVNQDYANLLLGVLKPGDTLMVNDYHLMLVPKLVKDVLPDVAIFFFLHIPFPTFEIFRLLPNAWRLDLLRGIIGADVVGFHTSDYTSYFLHCVQRLLGHEIRTEGNIFQVSTANHEVRVGTFPLGIDFERFDSLARKPELIEKTAEIKTSAKETCIVISVDRLDYTKGILNRLKGYELFLVQNPDWRTKVTLVMLVTPSREAVEHYQLMKRQIDEAVGSINGRFANMDWTPILYQYKTLPLEMLTPYYCASNVALVTPIRDGMNLVAKEYVASHPDNRGVLILSEMAGAAKELREAVLVNPNSIEEIAAALKQAVEMPEAEQIRRNVPMRKRLRRYNIFRWAEEFFEAL
jgi:trehalose 6-phosphate synthase/phosphatase